MQLALNLYDDGKRSQRFIPSVGIEQLVLSPLNPRRTRDTKRIGEIATLMSANGFDPSFALKAYRENGHYEVFAGGNRLAAAKEAGLVEVPVFLHEGYSRAEIWKLAYLDNEQTGKFSEVPVVDVWLDYADTMEREGWSQAQLANYLGISTALVSYRLTFAGFPAPVLDAFTKHPLSESHARELARTSQCEGLGNWLSREQAMVEVIDNVLARTNSPTARQFASEVAKYNGLIELVEQLRDQLPDGWQDSYIAQLAEDRVRTKAEAQVAYNKIQEQLIAEQRKQEQELARQQSEAEAERIRLEREAELNARIEEILSKVKLGDARELIHKAPAGFKLLFTDPPYGKDFQSNRRVVATKAPKIANDESREQALDLLQDVLCAAYTRMADDAAVLVWCDWESEPLFRHVIEYAGFAVKNSIVWVKPNHGTGDLDGTFAPRHERLLFGVKGRPVLRKRIDDVQNGSAFLGTGHPTEKPTDLIKELIQVLTHEGDCVVDPFVGGGSTVITAFETGRDFYGCELADQWYKIVADELYSRITGEGDNAE